MLNEDIFKPGDIFITRNENEEQNTTPGYWNHIAIYTNNGMIEAQTKPWNSVIRSDTQEFINRYYKLRVYRWNEEIGDKVAKNVLAIIGRPYGKYRSFMYKFLRQLSLKKVNCVSSVRWLYDKALGFDPGWKLPDDVIKDSRLTLVYNKDEK